MKNLVLAACIGLSSLAHAENLKTETSEGKYSIVNISAQKVKGVSVRLAQEITRNDCNRRSIDLNLAFVDGNQDVAWNQTDFASAKTYMTEMFCPLDKPVKETAYSKSVELKSLNNENAQGEIDVTLIVPLGYKVDVSELN